jgi:hypothetical protein
MFDVELDELGMRTKVLLAFVALGAGWLALQTGVVEAVLALGLTSPTVAGLVVLAMLAYWALDELDDDDDATDVIRKTSERAENASKGFLDGTAALIMGVAAILMTIGMQAFDALLAFVDVASQLPLAFANVGAILAGIGGALGFLAAPEVAAIGVVLLIGALIARRRETRG